MENKIDILKQSISDLFLAYINDEQFSLSIHEINACSFFELCEYNRLDIILREKIDISLFGSKILNKVESKKEHLSNKIAGYNRLALQIAKEFYKDNIKFVFIKGYSLFLSQYQKTCHRYYNDLDILVSNKDIDKVSLALKKIGFRYGRVRNGHFIEAKREEIIYQRINTHELHNMVIINHNDYFNVDINFRFSWRGIDNEFEKMKNIPIDLVLKNTITIKENGILMPILNSEFQFLHLCCHFYNEAIFFALNRNYKGGDPKEILLIRLLDILIIMQTEISLEKIVKICKEYNCLYKVQYVMWILFQIDKKLVSDNFWQFLEMDNYRHRNYYYTKNKERVEWEHGVMERIFCMQYKMVEIKSGT